MKEKNNCSWGQNCDYGKEYAITTFSKTWAFYNENQILFFSFKIQIWEILSDFIARKTSLWLFATAIEELPKNMKKKKVLFRSFHNLFKTKILSPFAMYLSLWENIIPNLFSPFSFCGQDLVRQFLFDGVDSLGSKTFLDYFPEYRLENGTVNNRRSMMGKSYETRPWNSKGEFIGG